LTDDEHAERLSATRTRILALMEIEQIIAQAGTAQALDYIRAELTDLRRRNWAHGRVAGP
jgi:hypothetical protein